MPFNIAQLARRLYSKYVDGPTDHVLEKVKEVEDGMFDAEIAELQSLDREALKERYETREKRL